MSPQRHIYACIVFAIESIGEMISHGRNAFQLNLIYIKNKKAKREGKFGDEKYGNNLETIKVSTAWYANYLIG